MFILFGAKPIISPPMPTGRTCSECGCIESIFVVPAQEYFHVFWIPMFPLVKKYTFICNNCGGEFTEPKKEIPLEVKRQCKTPRWAFIGSVISVIAIVALVTFAEISNSKNRIQYNEWIDNPEINDVYEVKLDTEGYSLMKVVSFTSDSIYFYPYSEYTDLFSGLKELSGADYLGEEHIQGYLKDELKNGIEESNVLKIRR